MKKTINDNEFDSKTLSNESAQNKSNQINDFVDNSPEAIEMRKFQQQVDQSEESVSLQAYQDSISTDAEGMSSVKKKNTTGIPDKLKAKIERESGISLDDVTVHYNSSKPEELGAYAYTEGTNIYIAKGQEEYLAHELWHVVQQKQGRVSKTTEVNGKKINEDKGLEQEAEKIGIQGPKGSGSKEMPMNSPPQQQDVQTPLVQRARKNKAELMALTVGAFDQHRKAEQMDWANDPKFTETERKVIWGIIDWGLSGLATLKIETVVKEVLADAKNFTYIKNYCEAINGALGGDPTVQLIQLSNMSEIEKQGKWVAKLNKTIGGPMVKATIPRPAFKKLIADEPTAESFLTYYTSQNPILQTPTGEEVKAYVKLVKDEGAKIADYTGALPDIRNYHKFEKASLDKLKADKGQKDRPLTLILQSLYDHNGAFIRHQHVNKVIQNANIRAYAIEGPDVAKIQELTATGLASIAAKHGMGGKITQMMVAGHGNSTMVEMAGSKTEVKQNPKTGEYTSNPDKSDTPLYLGNASYEKFWGDFFEAAFNNMDTKGGLKPKVLLRACLTSSNEIDYDKLKKSLLGKGLNLDDKKIDPTTTSNQTIIRAAIKDQYAKHGSLVTMLEGKAKGRADILGAQASITAGTTGSINEKTGELGVIALTDPKVAGPKIEYVRHGIEPTGALKAVIESWADDKDKCFKQMQERINNPVNTDDGFIIQLLYSTILANYKDDILTANKLVSTAGTLSHIALGGAHCRPVSLKKDQMIQKHKAAFYPALLLKFGRKAAQLAIYQDWMQTDKTKGKDFVDLLANPAFNKNNVTKYLDFSMLNADVKTLLSGSGALRGRILLALVGFIDNKKNADCKAFLNTQVDKDKVLVKAVKDELQGYSEDKLRSDLGLPVEAAPIVGKKAPVGGGKGHTKNVDIVSNDFYVAPVRAETKKMTKAKLKDKAKLMAEPTTGSKQLGKFYFKKDFTVVGELKKIADDTDAGWFMLRKKDGTVAYMETKYF
ncbi:eCIS core domain-containing protein [Aureispira anguillae]|uniref:DUF4157 domain-containing protein n=1 Tax=Aureispira anguillae TaxID=2864201 RepID=A0A915YJI2_9BACT|nr:DUF4157 domain-containing protein [Aureispira anguillae]BDS14101.1 DUF4157 domain-containing protein [Aureispira anguillae]